MSRWFANTKGASRIGLSLVLVAVVTAGVGMVSAQLEEEEPIDSCVHDSTGRVRMIDVDAGDTCRGNETMVTWNLEGPEGPEGPQGPQGDAGPQGVQGLAGESAEVIGTIRFGVSDEACPTDEYRLIVAQSEGVPPRIVSGPCRAIDQYFGAGWSGNAAIPSSAANTVESLYWSTTWGGFEPLAGERWRLRCESWTKSVDIAYENSEVVIGDDDLVRWGCWVDLRNPSNPTYPTYPTYPSYPIDPYPTVDPALDQVREAIESGELLSAPITFYETTTLPDTPLLSTTTSSTTTTTPEPPASIDCPMVGDVVQRADAMISLWRLAGMLAPAMNGSDLYGDVPVGSVYDAAVGWATEEGITTGVAPGIFGPFESLSREQYIAFVWRYYGSPAPAGANPWSDMDGSFAEVAATWASEQGIPGTGPSTFGGGDLILHDDAALWLGILDGAFDYWDCMIFGPI